MSQRFQYLSRGLSSIAIGKHGEYWNPGKSPYNFERYQGDLERRMTARLENDPSVKKWMQRHEITIPWIDGHKHQRGYVPDFIVEYLDGRNGLIPGCRYEVITTHTAGAGD